MLFEHVAKHATFQAIYSSKYNDQGLDNKYEALLRVTQDTEHIKFVLFEGNLQGGVLIGDTGFEETMENLILDQLNLF